jgi:hypothetical protein
MLAKDLINGEMQVAANLDPFVDVFQVTEEFKIERGFAKSLKSGRRFGCRSIA